MRTLLIVTWSVWWVSGISQIHFDSQFENGILDSAYQQSGMHTLAPSVSIHARATGCKDSVPIFRIYDEEGFRLRSYHRMVYRYASDTNWQYFDTGYKAGTKAYYHFQNVTPFQEDTVFIAYWYPWTYTQQTALMSQLAKAPFVTASGTLAQTPLGNNLYWLEMTDTNVANCYKKKVVITGRQHPIEFPQGYIIRGLCQFLADGTDTLAQWLLQRYRFLVLPMLNPDGVVLGIGTNTLGQGLNRDWSPGIAPGGCPEIDSAKAFIYERFDGSADFTIDIHGNPGSNLPYYWWGFNNQSPVGQDSIQIATRYVAEVAQADQLNGQNLFQSFVQGNGVNSAFTAGNWMYKTLGAIAFTFEPTSEPLSLTSDHVDIARFEKVGESLIRGFQAVYDGPEPLQAALDTANGWASITITGGISPYDIFWNNNRQDSIDISAGGTFTARVVDSSGCTLVDSISVAPVIGFRARESTSKVTAYWQDGTLTVSGALSPDSSIEFWDLQGHLLRKLRIEGNQSQYAFPNISRQAILVVISDQQGRQLWNGLIFP